MLYIIKNSFIQNDKVPINLLENIYEKIIFILYFKIKINFLKKLIYNL